MERGAREDAQSELSQQDEKEERRGIHEAAFQEDDAQGGGQHFRGCGGCANMVKGRRHEEHGRWTRARTVMDSGCGTSVAPPGMCPAYPIEESEGSKAGQEFVSASEDKLPNLGEQTLSAVLQDDSETSVKYQIADIRMPLNSGSNSCDSGKQLIFGRSDGMIRNVSTGKETHFTRENGVYFLKFWVKPSSEGFQRQREE